MCQSALKDVTKNYYNRPVKSLCTALVATLLAGCGVSSGDVIKVDGSSTVFPITQAVAEEYGRRTKARITIGVSGTGGGFKKLCRGEVHITGASRPIKAVEREQCAARGIRYIELPIAYDGLAVVVNPDNDWVTAMTTAELKRLWETRSPIDRWNELRGE